MVSSSAPTPLSANNCNKSHRLKGRARKKNNHPKPRNTEQFLQRLYKWIGPWWLRQPQAASSSPPPRSYTNLYRENGPTAPAGCPSASKAEGPSAASAVGWQGPGSPIGRLDHPGAMPLFQAPTSIPAAQSKAVFSTLAFLGRTRERCPGRGGHSTLSDPAQSRSSSPQQKLSGTLPCLPPLLPHRPPAPRGAPSATTRVTASRLHLPLSQPGALLLPSRGLGQEDVYAQRC